MKNLKLVFLLAISMLVISCGISTTETEETSVDSTVVEPIEAPIDSLITDTLVTE